jgi:uncharacterized protein (UPF0276 family)
MQEPQAASELACAASTIGDFIAAPQPVDWLEVISENYLVAGGKPLCTISTASAVTIRW